MIDGKLNPWDTLIMDSDKDYDVGNIYLFGHYYVPAYDDDLSKNCGEKRENKSNIKHHMP